MKEQLNEIKRMQQLAGLINESELDEAVDTLNIQTKNSEEGNKQITLSVLGGGWTENELTLSTEEAKALIELAKKFVGDRRSISDGVNTKDKNSTQSTISIEPDKLSLIISRKEGSTYKGYDEPIEASAGYLKAQQSIIYQIVEDLPGKLNESIEEALPTQPAVSTPAKTSDVKTLVKYIETKSDFLSKLERVSNGQEVTEFLSFILNKINDKVSGVNKNTLIKIINSRFK